MDPERSPETIVTIQFPDCDPYGHLNNSRYIDYFLNARDNQVFEYYNFDSREVSEGLHQGWVVEQTKISYNLPAVYREKVVIRTRLIQVTDRNVVMEAIMMDEKKKRIKALMWIEVVWVDFLTQRPVNHEPQLQRLLDSIKIEDYEYSPEKFDDRLSEVSKEIKFDLRKKREASLAVAGLDQLSARS